MSSEVRRLITDPDATKSRYIRSDWLAAWVAKNLLIQFQANQQGNRRLVGVLQQMVGDYVYSLGAQKKVIQLLSELRLSASLRYLENKRFEQRQTFMYEGYTVDPMAFLASTIDNFEMTDKRDGQVHHWVFQSMMQLDVEQLKKLGFYAENEEDRICRKGTTLDELKEEYESQGRDWIEEVFLERPSDLEDFSFYLLSYIKCAITTRLPTVDACRKMKESGNFSQCPTHLPRNLGIDVHPRKFDPKERDHRFEPRSYVPSTRPDDYYQYKTSDLAPKEEALQTMLSVNNVKMDIPLKDDLNKKDVVLKFLVSYADMMDDQLRNAVMEEGKERPVAEIMHPHVSDGSPISQILSTLDQFALQNDPKYSKIRPFCGGFHMMKDLIHAKHKLTEAFTFETIKAHRATDRRKKKFLYPSDPNEFEEEEIERLLAILGDAVDRYVEAKEHSWTDQVDVNLYNDLPAAAMAVLQHMLKCAELHPDSNDCLIDVYNSILYVMMRDSEKCNSCELFFTVVRLALPLFITTNCPKYVRICFELLLWRATAPTAEVVLFRETAFTRETPGKKHIWADRAEEKINGYVRAENGDCVMAGTDAKVDAIVLGLNERLQMKQNVRATKGQKVHRSAPFNESAIPVSHVFVNARLAVHELRVWDLGRPVRDNVLRSSDGQLVPTEKLQYRSVGYKRVWEYGDVFYNKNRFSVSRPTSYKTGGVPTGRLRSLPSQLNMNESTRHALMTSLSKEDLLKASKNKKAPLITELMDIRGKLDEAPTFTRAKLQKLKVDELIEKLIDCRKSYIKQVQQEEDMDVAFQLLDGEDLSKMDAYSAPDLRKEELSLDFYQLSQTQRNRFADEVEVARFSINE